jgi:glutaredoxin-related protein
MTEKVVKTKYATITYRSDGIIHLHYLDHLLVLEESKELFMTIRENSPWNVCPLYINGETFSGMDIESKAFFASEEVLKHCSSVAVLVRNIGQKILTNFYFKLIKSKIPTRFFSSEAEAIKWSLNYKEIKAKIN